MEAHIQSQFSVYGIFVGQSGNATHFSVSTSVFTCHCHSTSAPFLCVCHWCYIHL